MEARLSATPASSGFSVLVKMADQVDMQSLKVGLRAKNAQLSQRHREVIQALKQKAEASQKSIVSYLNSAKNSGRIRDFKVFWIANLIWAEAPRSEIENLARRPDVETIYLAPKVELVEPVDFQKLEHWAQPTGRTEPGLKAIKAPLVWGLGYKGKGRLLCNIDTGVDGTHPALAARWRGNFLPPDQRGAAWFDPVYGTTTPNDNKVPLALGHGTFTMGIMAGEPDLNSFDTIGVAPEAQWIAAQAIDLPGVNWPVEIAALQWAADPDGDPTTVTDVPDVVNNSWGIPRYDRLYCIRTTLPDCWDLYWQVLDNLAAAGPVVIFAAGNEGACGENSLRNPADRIASDYNTFAVGSINANDSLYPLSGFSSLGPSSCDGLTIKPEVVAPGEGVISSCPGGYCIGYGTSFSAPHVAGAAALLKEINPNATSDQILRALSVTALDLGQIGEDNSYGQGLIDVLAAIDSLPALNLPHIFVSNFGFPGDDNHAPDPGEALILALTLTNDGLSAVSVRATLSSTSPLVTVTDSTSSLGDMPRYDTTATSDYLQFSVSPSARPGEKLSFVLRIDAEVLGPGAETSLYSVSYPLLFYVTARPLEVKGDVDRGNLIFTISNFGQYGFGSGSFNSGLGADSGKGFQYPKNGLNFLYEAAVIFGVPPGKVSDAARNHTGILPDSDFTVAPGGELVFDTTSSYRKSAQDGFAIMTDEKAENPIGLKIVQRSYVYSDPAHANFVILEYTLHNQSGSDLTGLRVGFFTDWNFPWGSGDKDQAGFARSQNLGYMFQSGTNACRGVAVVSDSGASSFKAIKNSLILQDGFTDTEKWTLLSGGITDTVLGPTQDGSILIGSGPYYLGVADSVRVAFALMGSTCGIDSLKRVAGRAKAQYADLRLCLAIPGDLGASGNISITDVIDLVNYIFDQDRPPCQGVEPGNCWTPVPICRGDVNASGTITLGDVIALVNFIFDKDRLPCLGAEPGNCWTPEPIGVCCLTALDYHGCE